MHQNHFVKAGLFALLLVTVFVAGWEGYLRSQDVTVAYDDGKELWADKRARVYMPSDKSTVFIGSSRIKYDLDVPTWKALTGEDAIQLAMEGNSPLPILDDLAGDEKFRGKLVIDVTEGLFFSTSPHNTRDPKKNIAFFKKQTPTEKISFELNRGLESQLVFLDRDNFSMNAFFDKMRISNRPGVFTMPLFPLEFGRISFERQNVMTDRFLTDTNLQNMVTGNWIFFQQMNKEPPASGGKLDSIVASVRSAIDKITSRGGKVVFVRTPSSGPFLKGEQLAFPREVYWDRILQETGAPGIHFQDYKETAHFICPEWSHLSPRDAVIYTKNLAVILQEEKGWKFSPSFSNQTITRH